MEIATDPDLLVPRTFVLATTYTAYTKCCVYRLMPSTFYPNLCTKSRLRSVQKLKSDCVS